MARLRRRVGSAGRPMSGSGEWLYYMGGLFGGEGRGGNAECRSWSAELGLWNAAPVGVEAATAIAENAASPRWGLSVAEDPCTLGVAGQRRTPLADRQDTEMLSKPVARE